MKKLTAKQMTHRIVARHQSTNKLQRVVAVGPAKKMSARIKGLQRMHPNLTLHVEPWTN